MDFWIIEKQNLKCKEILVIFYYENKENCLNIGCKNWKFAHCIFNSLDFLSNFYKLQFKGSGYILHMDLVEVSEHPIFLKAKHFYN